VLAKLSEVLFVQTLRAYITNLPLGQTGWLAGARDPEVGETLALMHRIPGQSLLWRKKLEYHVRYWPSASGTTSMNLRWRT